MESIPTIEEIWDKVFKSCFGQWSKETICYCCSLRRPCQQADPTVSDRLKKIFHAEWVVEKNAENNP